MLLKQFMLITLLSLVTTLVSPLLSADSLKDSNAIGAQLIKNNCFGCHTPTDDGLSRISEQRKTPEGWEMTINRMRLMHGLKISNHNISFDKSAMHEMVKYLADTQGLAPKETQSYRYLLEQDLNQVEQHDDETLGVMCGRCHSSGRVALQRRAKDEWNYLIDFHLGQWPSTEYSLFGRDRNWLKDAREKIVPYLAKNYALDNKDWKQWQTVQKPNLQGKWVLSGHMPDKGFFTATMQVSQDKQDYYSLTVNGQYANGEKLQGTGSSVVYTGYEWRGVINFGDIKLRQTLAANQQGNELTGRFYQQGQIRVGMKIKAIKDSNKSQILSVSPQQIKKGQTTTLLITGTGLNDKLRFSNGIVIKDVLEESKNHLLLSVQANTNANSGYIDIVLGKASLTNKLAVYSQVNQLEILPAYGVARVGGNGGSTPKMNTFFRAYGIDYGADGKAGTDDDIKLGIIEDVRWHVVPRDEVAVADEDVKFAGYMNAITGIFQPADAGPNPARKRSTNNAGNLNVVATLEQGDKTITAQGRLLVTVQRWNNPPIK